MPHTPGIASAPFDMLGAWQSSTPAAPPRLLRRFASRNDREEKPGNDGER
ncbi:MAG: hypothetical protein WBE46_06215 [Dehalococcoidia bacterium]